jgi:hypothetical protein
MPRVSTTRSRLDIENKCDGLREAIDVVCEDAARVELWACALAGFSQPVPGYEQPYGQRPGSQSAVR